MWTSSSLDLYELDFELAILKYDLHNTGQNTPNTSVLPLNWYWNGFILIEKMSFTQIISTSHWITDNSVL